MRSPTINPSIEARLSEPKAAAPWLRNDKPYFIAELSCNHLGSLERSLEIVRQAAANGASALKTQTYRADGIAAKAPQGAEGKKGYSLDGTEWEGKKSLWHLLNEAAMPWEFNKPIREEAHRLGMDFMSSPFEVAAVDQLESIGGVDAYKIASLEITDTVLLRKVASTHRPVVVSTGMATKEEIADAMHELRSHGAGPIALLKCTSAYPATVDQANLKTLVDMPARFPGATIGVSDHTLGPAVPVAAISMGARVFEKHLILSREDGGPDSTFSVTPSEWGEMVKLCNSAHAAMGKVHYGPVEGEVTQFRRSLFCVKPIKKGEAFLPECHDVDTKVSQHNVGALRPCIGLEPKHLDSLKGKVATKDLPAMHSITWDDVEGGAPETRATKADIDRPGASLGGTRILITGGTGTIGNQIIHYLKTMPSHPKEVVVVSRDELKQSEMKVRFHGFAFPIRFELGDIRDESALELLMRGVDVVLHAAALKQVPPVEDNPMEGIKTNIMGTYNVVSSAYKAGVKKLLFISTDKAVSPSNAYGATKLVAERVVLAAARKSLAGNANPMAIAICRYGNVFASRGSIVPVVHNIMLKEKNPMISVTDPNMTRFTLSGETAVKLVMASVDNMVGGEVFIPKLPTYRLDDLLEAMGVPPSCMKVVGHRPGEKLHETLMFDAESARAVDAGWFYIVPPEMEEWGAGQKGVKARIAPIGRYHSGNPGETKMDADGLRAVYEAWKKKTNWV